MLRSELKGVVQGKVTEVIAEIEARAREIENAAAPILQTGWVQGVPEPDDPDVNLNGAPRDGRDCAPTWAERSDVDQSDAKALVNEINESDRAPKVPGPGMFAVPEFPTVRVGGELPAFEAPSLDDLSVAIPAATLASFTPTFSVPTIPFKPITL